MNFFLPAVLVKLVPCFFGSICNSILSTVCMKYQCLKQLVKKIVQKSAEAAGELVWNKIIDKIISLGKSKIKENENEINEPEEIIISTENRQKIINDLRLF